MKNINSSQLLIISLRACLDSKLEVFELVYKLNDYAEWMAGYRVHFSIQDELAKVVNANPCHLFSKV